MLVLRPEDTTVQTRWGELSARAAALSDMRSSGAQQHTQNSQVNLLWSALQWLLQGVIAGRQKLGLRVENKLL